MIKTLYLFRLGWGTLPIVVFLLTWELVARLELMPGHFFFPSFSQVMVQFHSLVVSGVLADHFLASLLRVLVGFIAGSLAGVGIGILMGWSRIAHSSLSPIISLFFPIPALGWLPILMLWFGIGEILPISIVFICSFFPIAYTTTTGIRTVDESYVMVAKTLGASRSQILTKVLIPLALPSIFTGLRLEAGMVWRVIIAAEMVAIPTGIGALLMRSQSLLRVDIVIVCLVVLAAMCLLFERFFLWLERRITGGWIRNN